MSSDSAADIDLNYLYYNCVGYVVNLSSSSNHSVGLSPDDVDVTSSSTMGMHPSLKDILDKCELLRQSLHRPSHDSRRYTRELLTYLLMGVAGSTVGCFGLIGNLLSLIVLTRRNMRTSTYCYLAALAICDLLTVFCMLILLIKDTRRPEPASPTWPAEDDAGFYPYLFPYLHPAAFTLQVSSVWLTLAFTVDRYIMICHPFQSEPFCTVRRARKVVASLIAASIAFNLPKFFEYRTVVMPVAVGEPPGVAYSNYDVVYTDLTDFGRSRRFKELYHSWLYTVFVFGLPFTALLVLNGFLVQAVRISRLRTQELSRRTTKSAKRVEQVLTSPRATTAASSVQPLSCPPLNYSPTPARAHDATVASPVPRPPSTLALIENRVLPSAPSSPVSKRIDTTVMLIGVVIIFIVCQFPALVSRTLWAFEEEPSAAFTKLPMYTLNEVANFLVLLNSSVNIVPYYFFGRRFRRQFLELFCPRCATNNSSSIGGSTIAGEHPVLAARLPFLRRRRHDIHNDSSIGYNTAINELRNVPPRRSANVQHT